MAGAYINISSALPYKSLFIQWTNGAPIIVYNNTGASDWIITHVNTGIYTIESVTFSVDWLQTVVNVSNIYTSNVMFDLAYKSDTTTDPFITIVCTDLIGIPSDNGFLYASANISFFQ